MRRAFFPRPPTPAVQTLDPDQCGHHYRTRCPDCDRVFDVDRLVADADAEMRMRAAADRNAHDWEGNAQDALTKLDAAKAALIDIKRRAKSLYGDWDKDKESTKQFAGYIRELFDVARAAVEEIES